MRWWKIVLNDIVRKHWNELFSKDKSNFHFLSHTLRSNFSSNMAEFRQHGVFDETVDEIIWVTIFQFTLTFSWHIKRQRKVKQLPVDIPLTFYIWKLTSLDVLTKRWHFFSDLTFCWRNHRILSFEIYLFENVKENVKALNLNFPAAYILQENSRTNIIV